MWHMCSYTKTNRGDKCDSMAPDPDKFNPNTNVTPDVKNGRICHACDKCDLCKMYGNSRIYCPWCREWHFELSALGNSSKYHILHLGKRFDCFPKHPWFFLCIRFRKYWYIIFDLNNIPSLIYVFCLASLAFLGQAFLFLAFLDLYDIDIYIGGWANRLNDSVLGLSYVTITFASHMLMNKDIDKGIV